MSCQTLLTHNHGFLQTLHVRLNTICCSISVYTHVQKLAHACAQALLQLQEHHFNYEVCDVGITGCRM